MRPILLATDGSPSAEAATAKAIHLARSLHVPLVVACVAHEASPMHGAYYGFPEIAAEARRAGAEHVADVLERTRVRASKAGADCRMLELEGPRGPALCGAAAAAKARLVVVGAHGWDRIGRMIHGSVSTYVVQHAPCPVLVVHGEDVAAEAEVAPAGTAAPTG